MVSYAELACQQRWGPEGCDLDVVDPGGSAESWGFERASQAPGTHPKKWSEKKVLEKLRLSREEVI